MWTPVHGYNTQVSLWLSTMRLVKVGFHFLLLNRYCSRCGAHCRLQLRRLKLVQGQLEFVAQHKQRGWHPRGEELSGPVVQEWSKLFVNVQPCAMCALMPFLSDWGALLPHSRGGSMNSFVGQVGCEIFWEELGSIICCDCVWETPAGKVSLQSVYNHPGHDWGHWYDFGPHRVKVVGHHQEPLMVGYPVGFPANV